MGRASQGPSSRARLLAAFVASCSAALGVQTAWADVVSWTTEAELLGGSLDGVTVAPGGVLELSASSDWFDAAWSWRSPVTVTEQSGRAVTDYTVEITLDTASLVAAGQLEADGRDLRFTDDAGGLLGHWVEAGMNTAATTVWVMVPTLSGGGSIDLWMYHGNPVASDTSDRSAAMLWWDDFSDPATLAEYESQGLNGDGDETWTISGGEASNTNDIYTFATLLVSGLELDDDFLVETEAWTNDDDSLGLVSHVDGSGTSYYAAQTHGESQPARTGICKNQTEAACASQAGLSISIGSSHTYSMVHVAGELRMVFDGSEVAIWTDPAPLPAGRIGLLAGHLSPSGFFDYLLIRSYVEPEPGVTVGVAESAGTSTGSWESEVVDAGCSATWDTLTWTETLPAGTDVEFEVRSGWTPAPGGEWSGWSAAVSDPAGSPLSVPDGRYGQVRAVLTGTTAGSPEVMGVELEFSPQWDADGDGGVSAACGGDDCDDQDPTVYAGASESCDSLDSDCDGSLVDEFLDTDLDGDPDCTDPDDDGDGDLDGTDCGPLDPTVYIGAPELCDAVDSDCDADLVDGFDDTDGDDDPDCTDLDDDGDGDPDATDCAPLDPSLHAGAAEVCDGVDQDCDGLVDDGLDTDGDSVTTCGPDGLIDTADDDWDDGDPSIYPGALEACGDGVDQDCDGLDTVDEDGDGFSAAWCGGDDCQDGDAAVNPGAVEICGDGVDQDCDGGDASTGDLDGDGFSECTGDCDDSDPDLSPAESELCDGIDNDCDGEIDEDFPEVCDTCLDADGDGVTDCDGDCDDADPLVFPGAAEICDGLDSDCDGVTPAGELDQDGDGLSTCTGDCDDLDDTVHPGALEVSDDGIDQDCSGADTVTCWEDEDGDGFGGDVPLLAEGECDGDGLSDLDTDCDDEDDQVYPDAPELCDGVDNDCDGAVDDDVEAWDWFADADGDGAGDPDAPFEDNPSCDQPEGFVLDASDCDDSDPERHPGAEEVCDGVDGDCDGQLAGFEQDADGDGLASCEGDCDDADPAVFPGAEEVCGDGIDQDCDASEDADWDDPECWTVDCSLSGRPAPLAAVLALLAAGLVRVGRRRALRPA